MNVSDNTRLKKILATIDRVMFVVAIVALLALLAEWGWAATLSPWALKAVFAVTALAITFFLFETLARVILAPSTWRHVHANLFEIILTAVFLILLFSAKHIYSAAAVSGRLRPYGIDPARFHLILGQIYLLLSVLLKAIALQKHLSATGIRPAPVVVLSFAVIISIGTILLSSPHAVSRDSLIRDGTPSFVDSFFTATSCVCVTGLIVKDTGAYWSTFGQGVIICLIQIGGLGLMTFVTFSSLIVGKGIALREQVVMQDVLSYDVMAKLPRLIIYILLVTFTAEAIGAVLLYPVWQGNISVLRRAYLSAFHAISAFCNAGFSLFSGSFTEYRGSITLNAVVTGLIIFGGLGFIVHRNIAARLYRALKGRLGRHSVLLKNTRESGPRVFFTLQTKIVLITTAVLLVAGGVLFASLEWTGGLSGMSLKEKILCTWFQTVTPRTAGFNTVGFSALRVPTYLLMVVLMFIGASPGGTGGGIKTSTFAILIATIYSGLRHRPNVESLRRSIPAETVRQAVMVVLLGISLVVAGVFVLSITEKGIAFERLLFEQMSAFGTVGLSPGAPGTALSLSASLSWVGKLVIIVTMFAGRIGPLTLVIAIAQKRRVVGYEYPEEQVVIG